MWHTKHRIQHMYVYIFSPLLLLPKRLSPFFLRFYLFTFRERGRVGERKEEKHQYVRDTRTPATAYLARNPGMWRALTGNRTSNVLVCRSAPNPLSHPSQSKPNNFLKSQLLQKLPSWYFASGLVLV